MAYTVDKIRNVCLLGHGGEGKTTLAESLLFMTGGIDRQGRTVDGNTTCDFDDEEIKRQISISSALAPVEFEGNIINIIDTPGYFDFEGEVAQALRVADCGIIVASAKNGCMVGTEKAWKAVQKRKLPSIFYISKLDEENANFDNAYESLRAAFGKQVTPFVIPLFDENSKAYGVINLVKEKVYTCKGTKVTESEIPEAKKAKVERLREALIESVASTSEELMEKYFSGETFTNEELETGLRAAVLAGDVVPVVCGSAAESFGTMQTLRSIMEFAPAPNEVRVERGADENGADVELHYEPDGRAVIFVFKTLADQYGRFSYFKVMSGKVNSETTMVNSRTGTVERFNHIYISKGKKLYEREEIGVGDIGAVSKLSDTKTGDTLCAPGGPRIYLNSIAFNQPCYSQAILPKVKGTEDKIAAGLNKLRDEDPAFTLVNNTETKQMVLSGMGDIHLDVLCSKLKNKFGVEVTLEAPKVAYRETIRKKVELVEGNHKKQSGGHGQYGNVKMNFEPTTEADYIFEEQVFGGAVPKNFFPAVEKGIKEAMEHGVLAGFPMVGLKATLMDGKYHDVDSNELSFKVAARLAYKAGIPKANPVILEPVNSMKVYVPDNYMGDVIGDLNKRRGRILGMVPEGDGIQCIEAEVPASEVADYAITLRSMTQGRGSFVSEFARYEQVPGNVQEKIIAENKANLVDDDE